MIGRALAAIVAFSAAGLVGCVADDPVEVTAAVLRVSIDSCAPGNEDLATAVSIGNGLALTAAHSFDDAEEVVLIDDTGSELGAELVHLDRERDIALLSFDEAALGPDGQRGLVVHSDADAPADQGRMVVYRRDGVVIQPVELLQRTAITLDGEGRRESIKLGAVIEAGDSGAPIIDGEDRVVGMIFATSRAGDTGWAVAASELIDLRDRAGPPIPLGC